MDGIQKVRGSGQMPVHQAYRDGSVGRALRSQCRGREIERPMVDIHLDELVGASTQAMPSLADAGSMASLQLGGGPAGTPSRSRPLAVHWRQRDESIVIGDNVMVASTIKCAGGFGSRVPITRHPALQVVSVHSSRSVFRRNTMRQKWPRRLLSTLLCATDYKWRAGRWHNQHKRSERNRFWKL